MSFLLCFWACLGWVNQIQIQWINDILSIRLNEPLSQYEDLPQAILYIDDKEVINPNVYYEKGVDRTFLSVVNTGIVRSYEVKYRVTFLDYNISQTHLIIFDVVDEIPPVILKMKTFEIPVGSKMPNFNEGLVFQDNYDDVALCTVEIIAHTVNLHLIGTYEITYIITDQSSNETSGKTTLTVYDYSPPEITLKKPIIHEVSQVFQWKDYITIKDNYDDWIDPLIDDSLIDYTRLGQYVITITASDQSNNQATLSTSMTIIDTLAPVILFKSNPKPIHVNDHISRAVLEDYILSVTDNYNTLSFDDLIITHDIDTSRLGVYKLYVTAYDESSNMGFNQLSIQVVDIEKPTIDLKEDLVFQVFEPKPHLIDYIIFEDNYTPSDELNITITGTFHMHLLGTYIITATATDQSKNKTTKHFHLTIVDEVAPTVSLKQELIVTDFMPKPLYLYIETSDNYDDARDLVIDIDDQKIDYNQTGMYEFTVCVYDLSFNQTCETFDLFVVDITPPTISLKHTHITIDTSITSINYNQIIESCDDNYDVILVSDVVIDSQVEYGVIGLYKVIFSISDFSNNKTTEVLYVRIDHFEELSYYSIPLTANLYENIDFLDGLKIDDMHKNYQVRVVSDHIDFNQPGTYEVIYVIIDQRGNQYIEKTTLTIHAPLTKTSYKSYIPLVAINTIGLSLIGFLTYKSRHINVFDNDE
ncbi:MAG: hypothetical protein ACNA7K_06240 [Acholeplasmataceae bacterium]